MLTRNEWLVAISAPNSAAVVRDLICMGHNPFQFTIEFSFSLLPLLQLACMEKCPMRFNLTRTQLTSCSQEFLPPRVQTVLALLDARANIRETDVDDTQTALFCAVSSYNVPVIELLLSRSSDIQCYTNRAGTTVMHEWAVASPVLHKEKQVYEAVLHCLAVLNPPPPFSHADHQGVTPLLMASKCNARNMIMYYKMLVMRGETVNVNYMDHERCAALHNIVDLTPDPIPMRDPTEKIEDRVEAMVLLLDNGADAFVGCYDASTRHNTPVEILENNTGYGADELREAFAAFLLRMRRIYSARHSSTKKRHVFS